MRPLLLLAMLLIGVTPLAAQSGDRLAITFRNDTGAIVDGLRLKFDVAIDPTVPVEPSLAGFVLGPFGPPAQPAPDTLVFSGASLLPTRLFPAGGSGLQIVFNPAQSGVVPRLVEAAWQIGGTDAHALHLIDWENPADDTIDAIELEARDANGTPIRARVFAALPDPFRSFRCNPTFSAVTSTRNRIDWGCAIAPGERMTQALVTLDGPNPATRMAVHYMSGTQVRARTLRFEQGPIAPSPALAATLTFDAPILRLNPDLPRPFPSVVGLGSLQVRLCGSAIGGGDAIGPFEVTATPDAAPMRLTQVDWIHLTPAQIMPDALYLAFDENDSASTSTSAHLHSGGSGAASITTFTTDQPGMFGTGLVGGGSSGTVETGLAAALGTGSWTFAAWIDLRSSSDPTVAQTLIADPQARDWRIDVNGGAVGNVRVSASGFGGGGFVMPAAIDATRPYHVLIVHDAPGGKLNGYIDGQLFATRSYFGLDLGVGGQLRVGRRSTNGSRIRSGTVLDEVGLWRRALDPAEIAIVSTTRLKGIETPASFEDNGIDATLTLGGVTADPHCPATLASDTNEIVQLVLGGNNRGQPFDLVLGSPRLLPAESGGFVLLDGQVLNLDPFSPATSFAFGGFVQPFLPIRTAIAPTAPFELGAQLAVLDPRKPSGLALSAPVRWQVERAALPTAIEIRARGSNSFNNSSTPFWSIAHGGTEFPITELTISTFDSSRTETRGIRFDLDQQFGNGEAIIFGNGTAGCLGSYADGSDVTTGLIYDSQNTYDQFGNGTCFGGNCGFIALPDPTLAAQDHKSVTFRFTPGFFFDNTFVFDMDTDGGPGVSGRAMEGVRVSITLLDGRVLTGELAVDPETSNQSVLRF